MKLKKLVSLCTVLAVLVVVYPCSAVGETVPMGVSPKKITAEWIQPGVAYKDILGDDKVLNAGDISNVKVQYGMVLEFYNVGTMGGNKYAEAVLKQKYTALDGGEIYKSKGPDGWPIKPSTIPQFPEEVHKLTFSGGPNGKFLAADGSSLEGYIDAKNNIVHLELKGTNAWQLQITTENAFKDWQDMTSNFDSSKSTSNFDQKPGDDQWAAQFSSINGEVEFRPDDKPGGWHFAKLNNLLYHAYHVKTGEESEAIISFRDLSTFRLGPESEIVVYDDRLREDSKISLVAGTIWSNIKKMAKDGTMDVEMSQGVLGIKGTTFVCEDNGQTSTLKVIEGTVEYKSKASPAQVVTVRGGEMAMANSSGMGAVEKFDVAAEKAKWDKMGANGSGRSGTLFALIGTAVVIALIAGGYFFKKRSPNH